MVELEQLRLELQAYEGPLQEVRDHFDLPGKEKRVEELERKMEEPDFWEDTEGSQKVMKELKMLKDTIQTAEELNRQFEDTDTLLEMAEEEEDASLAGEIREGIRRLDEHLEEVRISTS